MPLPLRYIVQEQWLFAVAAIAECDCRTLLVQGRGPAASLCGRPSIFSREPLPLTPDSARAGTDARLSRMMRRCECIELAEGGRVMTESAAAASTPTKRARVSAVTAWESLFRAQVAVMRTLAAEFPT